MGLILHFRGEKGQQLAPAPVNATFGALVAAMRSVLANFTLAERSPLLTAVDQRYRQLEPAGRLEDDQRRPQASKAVDHDGDAWLLLGHRAPLTDGT